MLCGCKPVMDASLKRYVKREEAYRCPSHICELGWINNGRIPSHRSHTHQVCGEEGERGSHEHGGEQDTFGHGRLVHLV